MRYNSFRMSSCRDISPGISAKISFQEVRSRFSINIIYCPKFLKVFPLSMRTSGTGLAKDSASGEGGDVGASGDALAEVPGFIVTINCSFKASCH